MRTVGQVKEIVLKGLLSSEDNALCPAERIQDVLGAALVRFGREASFLFEDSHVAVVARVPHLFNVVENVDGIAKRFLRERIVDARLVGGVLGDEWWVGTDVVGEQCPTEEMLHDPIFGKKCGEERAVRTIAPPRIAVAADQNSDPFVDGVDAGR